MKIFLKIILSIVIIAVILIIPAVVVINLTPQQLNFADKEIYQSNSMRSLGLADTKLIDIFKFMKSFANTKEGDIVTNPYVESTEKGNAEVNFNDVSNIPKDATSGEPTYSSMLTQPVLFDKVYQLSFSDTTLAYIFNKMISEISTSTTSNESFNFLAQINATISEISIINATETKASLRIVAGISLGSIKAEIKTAIGPLASIIPIPDKIFLVANFDEINVDSNKELTLISGTIKINDASSAIADAIFSVIAKNANLHLAEGQTAQSYIADKLGEGIKVVIKNLGKIEKAGATKPSTNPLEVDTTSPLPSTFGIENHKIWVVTKTA